MLTNGGFRRGLTIAALVVAGFIAIPVAAAAEASMSIDASLSFDDPPTLSGSLSAVTDRGSLDLARATAGAWELRWEGADVLRSTERGTRGPAGVWQGEANEPEEWRVGPATLTVEDCASSCVVLVEARDGGTIGIDGRADGTLEPVPRPARQSVPSASGSELVAYESPAFAFQFDVGPGPHSASLPFEEARIQLAGDVMIVLWGARATLHEGEGETTLRTGARTTPAGPAGLVENVENTYVVIHARGASFLGDATNAHLAVASPTWTLAGTLASTAATGELRVEGARHAIDDEAISMVGAFRGTMGTDGTVLGTTAHSDAQFSGDATSVEIDGHALSRSTASLPPALATGGGVLLALAALVAVMKFAPIAFYSRIGPTELLEHPTRARIHRHVRANPGSHVAQISRALGVRRVTLQHHLRLLENGQRVVGKRSGRVLAYYAPEHGGATARVDAQVALKDETRSRVLSAIKAAPTPLAQRDLVERLGISQRLASHHVHKLEAVGLVVGEGERPRRYTAAPTAPR